MVKTIVAAIARFVRSVEERFVVEAHDVMGHLAKTHDRLKAVEAEAQATIERSNVEFRKALDRQVKASTAAAKIGELIGR